MKNRFTIVVLLLIAFSSCTTSPYYQKQYAVPSAAWDSKFQPEFTIDLNDTQVNYNAYFIIRHDEAFPFSNIWLRLYIQAPDAENFIPLEKVDLLMATPNGSWLGKNIGNIWEQKLRIPININEYITKSGTYKFKIEQIMRTDPLPSVINIGLNVEKY